MKMVSRMLVLFIPWSLVLAGCDSDRPRNRVSKEAIRLTMQSKVKRADNNVESIAAQPVRNDVTPADHGSDPMEESLDVHGKHTDKPVAYRPIDTFTFNKAIAYGNDLVENIEFAATSGDAGFATHAARTMSESDREKVLFLVQNLGSLENALQQHPSLRRAVQIGRKYKDQV